MQMNLLNLEKRDSQTNANIRKRKLHICILHYVGLSRVINFEGLNITDLCENKIAVLQDVAKEMDRV